MSEALATTSFEDFLVVERLGVQRHEWVGGLIYAMAGGTERHDAAVEALRDILGPGARAAGCRRFTGNRLVRTAAAAYYPDLLVVCGKAADRHYETNAALIVEVRSPSTADVARREQAVAYQGLAGLDRYLIVDPHYCRIDVATRDTDRSWAWTTYGPGAVVLTPYGDIDVDNLYDEIDATSTTA